MRIQGRVATVVAAGIVLCIGLTFLTHLLCGQNVYNMVAVWLIGIGSVFVVVRLGSFPASQNAKFIIMIGYFLRVLLLLIAMFGHGHLTDILTDGDQVGFAKVAEEYFYGDYSTFYTRYPYIINILYQIVGLNRIVAQYVNIIIWFLGIEILFKIKKKWEGIVLQMLILLYALMPYPAMLSMALLRESILGFLLMLGMYFLYKWMDIGSFKYIVAAITVTFPAVILHTGMLSFWVGTVLTYMFWNYRKGRWEFVFWKVLLIAGGGLVLLTVYFSGYRIPLVMDYVPSYNSLTDRLKGGDFTKSRADYLTDLSYTSPMGFIFMVLMRCIYFWISPTPIYWNSGLDVLAFFVDSIPCVFLLLLNARKVMKEGKTGTGRAGMLILTVFTILYGLGTRNAGTAMRHRDTILGLLIVNYILGKNQKIESRDRIEIKKG